MKLAFILMIFTFGLILNDINLPIYGYKFRAANANLRLTGGNE